MVFLPIKLQLNYEKREYPELSKMRLEYGNFDKFFYIFSEFLLKNPYDSQVAICWHQSMDESARLAICALPHMRQNRQVWAAVYPQNLSWL